MTSGSWTHKEEIAIWKFAIKKLFDKKANTWTEFVKKINSSRYPVHVHARFTKVLLRRLHETKLHVETKLRFFQEYKLNVDNEEILKELNKGAELKVRRGVLKSFELKPDLEPNRDADLSDEELLGLIKPILTDLRPCKCDCWLVEKMELKEQHGVKRSSSSEPSTSAKRPRTSEGDEQEKEVIYEETVECGSHDNIEFDNNPDFADYSPGAPNLENGIKNEMTTQLLQEDTEKQAEVMEEMTETIRMPTGEMMEEQNREQADKVKMAKTMKTLEQNTSELVGMLAVMRGNMEKQAKETEQVQEHLKKQAHVMRKIKDQAASRKASLEQQISAMQAEIGMLRKEIRNVAPVDPTASTKQKFLLNFQKAVASIESPGMESVKKLLEDKIQKLEEEDEGTLDVDTLPHMLEVLVKKFL